MNAWASEKWRSNHEPPFTLRYPLSTATVHLGCPGEVRAGFHPWLKNCSSDSCTRPYNRRTLVTFATTLPVSLDSRLRGNDVRVAKFVVLHATAHSVLWSQTDAQPACAIGEGNHIKAARRRAEFAMDIPRCSTRAVPRLGSPRPWPSECRRTTAGFDRSAETRCSALAP